MTVFTFLFVAKSPQDLDLSFNSVYFHKVKSSQKENSSTFQLEPYFMAFLAIKSPKTHLLKMTPGWSWITSTCLVDTFSETNTVFDSITVKIHRYTNVCVFLIFLCLIADGPGKFWENCSSGMCVFAKCWSLKNREMVLRSKTTGVLL